MMPLVWLLNTITRILMRMMGIRTDTVISSALSKDELRTIVNESRLTNLTTQSGYAAVGAGPGEGQR